MIKINLIKQVIINNYILTILNEIDQLFFEKIVKNQDDRLKNMQFKMHIHVTSQDFVSYDIFSFFFFFSKPFFLLKTSFFRRLSWFLTIFKK